jgi:NADPH2:quinone reductase
MSSSGEVTSKRMGSTPVSSPAARLRAPYPQPTADFGGRLMAAFQRSLSVATFSAATVSGRARNAVRAEPFARRDLRAVVHDVLPLERAVEAHRRMDGGQVFGRIVLTSG